MNQASAEMLTALELAVRLSLPVLAAAFAAALVLALLSALSRLTEPALLGIPRALVTLLMVGATGSWAGGELLAYTVRLLRSLPDLVR